MALRPSIAPVPQYKYILGLEKPLVGSAIVQFEEDLRRLLNATDITVSELNAEFSSPLSPIETESAFRQLSLKYSRIELKGGSKVE